MKILINIVFLFIISCSYPKNNNELYSEKIGFELNKATVLISLENCSYCFGEYQETIKSLNTKIFNIVVISSQLKKASLFIEPDETNIFIDQDKLAIKLGLIESLPVMLLPNGSRKEIFSSKQLKEYATIFEK